MIESILATSADRQAVFRQRHLAEGNAERLNIMLEVSAKRQLERLARHRSTKQRAVIEALLAEAERRATARCVVPPRGSTSPLRSNAQACREWRHRPSLERGSGSGAFSEAHTKMW